MRSNSGVRIDNFGGPEVLRIEPLAWPEPQHGEFVLKIRAASVNPVDAKIREGKYPAVKAGMLPYVLGRDGAGEVVAIGPDSTFGVGEAVYVFLGIERGTNAQYVVVKDSEAALKPTSVDFAVAAAVPLAGLTAWQGLFRHGGLVAGQRILIHGGSGGVGHFAIQFAKAKGAHVITTVSEHHMDFVRDLGADEAIDYKNQRFEDDVRDVDMVFDLVAGETQDRSWGVIRRGGILVSTLTQPSEEKANAAGVRAMRYTAEPSGTELSEIAGLIDARSVRSVVDKTFPLADIAAAQHYLAEAHPKGKIVLLVD